MVPTREEKGWKSVKRCVSLLPVICGLQILSSLGENSLKDWKDQY